MKKISVLVICTLLLVSCGQKEVVVSPPPLKTGTGAPVSKIESASVVEKQSNTKEF